MDSDLLLYQIWNRNWLYIFCSIYHFNRVQRPLYNTANRIPQISNGPITLNTPYGSSALYHGYNPATLGSFNSISTVANSTNDSTTMLPFTTRNRLEVATDEEDDGNMSKKNNNISQSVIGDSEVRNLQVSLIQFTFLLFCCPSFITRLFHPQ